MDKYVMLVAYSTCNGCRKCERACRQAHNFTQEQSGVIVKTVGPFQVAVGKRLIDYIATPTDYCDHCAVNSDAGQSAACVQTCPVGCLRVGTTAQLKESVVEKKMVLFTLK